jgi:excisionase family DNA binding protein
MSKSAGKTVVSAPIRPIGTKELAEHLRRADKVRIVVNGVSFDVSPELDAAVRRASEAEAQPLPKEMTTIQAAAFLGVSRPFLVKLIARGELPCRLVGKHRRIPVSALRKYREKMFQQAKNACDELTRTSQELGLYDLEVSPPKAR